MNSTILLVFCAFFGALAVKLIEFTELSKLPKAKRPDITDLVYWLPFIILPLIGGGLAFIYIISGQTLSPILALNVGISAPLTIRTVAQVLPDQSRQINLPPDA
jgi:hypothetical protein